ncbi:hypothetical protein AB0D97_14205 [Streptomyces roseus]|uniref:hypothetical protein n=1 Tax=Streptomyces roseus TaxID=66430 RepID=UPI0033FB6CDC
MTFGELRRLLNTVPITADRDPVMFLDTDTADVFELHAVRHEGPSYDEGGNVTSVGGTVWIRGELH